MSGVATTSASWAESAEGCNSGSSVPVSAGREEKSSISMRMSPTTADTTDLSWSATSLADGISVSRADEGEIVGTCARGGPEDWAMMVRGKRGVLGVRAAVVAALASRS